MKKNKFVEIKNRTAYIHDLITELENVIKEAELEETINTSKEGGKALAGVPQAGSAANELEDDDEEIPECINYSLAGYIGGIVVILTIVYLLVSQ